MNEQGKIEMLMEATGDISEDIMRMAVQFGPQYAVSAVASSLIALLNEAYVGSETLDQRAEKTQYLAERMYKSMPSGVKKAELMIAAAYCILVSAAPEGLHQELEQMMSVQKMMESVG